MSQSNTLIQDTNIQHIKDKGKSPMMNKIMKLMLQGSSNTRIGCQNNLNGESNTTTQPRRT